MSKLLAVNAKLTRSLTKARLERDAEAGGGKAAGRGGGKRLHAAQPQPQPHGHAQGKPARPRPAKPHAVKAAKAYASKAMKSILAGITGRRLGVVSDAQHKADRPHRAATHASFDALDDWADARQDRGKGGDGQGGGGDSEEDGDGAEQEDERRQQKHYYLRSSVGGRGDRSGKSRGSSEAAEGLGLGTHGSMQTDRHSAHAHIHQLLRRREPRAKAPLARHAPSSAFSSPSSAAASYATNAQSSRHASSSTGRRSSSAAHDTTHHSSHRSSSNNSRARRAAAVAQFNAPRCADVTTAATESGKVSKSTAPSALHWVPGGLRGVDAIHSSLDADASALNTSMQSQHSHQSAHSHHSQPSRQQHHQQHHHHQDQQQQQQQHQHQQQHQRPRASSIDSEVSTDSRRSFQSFQSFRSAGSRDGRDDGRERQGERERRESPAKAAGIALSRRPRAVPPSLANHSAAAFWDGYDVLGSEADKRGHAFQGKTGLTPPHGHTHHTHAHSSSASGSVLHSPPSDLSRARPSPLTVPVLGAPEGYGKARDNDLQVVIQSLEEEFQSLNSQYRTLLKTVSSPARGAAEEDGFAADEKEGQLVEVIQKLHKRGEMLRKLKSPTRG